MSSRHDVVVIDDDGPLRDDAGADNATVGLRTAMNSTGSASTPSIWIQVMNLEEELSGSKATIAYLRTQFSSLQAEFARVQAENVRLRAQDQAGLVEHVHDNGLLPPRSPVNDGRHSRRFRGSHQDARPPKRPRTDPQTTSSVSEELHDHHINDNHFHGEDEAETKSTMRMDLDESPETDFRVDHQASSKLRSVFLDTEEATKSTASALTTSTWDDIDNARNKSNEEHAPTRTQKPTLQVKFYHLHDPSQVAPPKSPDRNASEARLLLQPTQHHETHANEMQELEQKLRLELRSELDARFVAIKTELQTSYEAEITRLSEALAEERMMQDALAKRLEALEEYNAGVEAMCKELNETRGTEPASPNHGEADGVAPAFPRWTRKRRRFEDL